MRRQCRGRAGQRPCNLEARQLVSQFQVIRRHLPTTGPACDRQRRGDMHAFQRVLGRAREFEVRVAAADFRGQALLVARYPGVDPRQ